MPSVEHPYDYRRAQLHELAAPSSVAATPNLTDIAQQHAAAKGAIAAKSQALKADLDLGEKRLAEQDRQFTAKLDLDRQQLDTWADQNKWATALAVANLGISGLSIPVAMKTVEKQDAHNLRMETKQDDQLRAITEGNAAREARQTKADAADAFRVTVPARIAALPSPVPAVLQSSPTFNLNLRDASPNYSLPYPNKRTYPYADPDQANWDGY